MSSTQDGMPSYDRRPNYRALYARLLTAMSMEEARETLGFPAGYSPSPNEISKAYKRKAIENHPDRGGDPAKMVEINVAKEILEGKRHDRYRPSAPTVDPEEAAKKDFEHKRAVALRIIERAASEVGQAAQHAINAADIARGKIHLREFFTEDYAEALDKMQDMIEAEKSPHPDMKKGEALCVSLSNKALRLGKRYVALIKLQGNAVASLTGMSGSDPLNFALLTDLYAQTHKFVMAFNDMYQESRKLAYLMRTSENVPLEWDEIYSSSHSMLDGFAGKVYGFGSFNDSQLKRFEKEMTEAVKNIGDAVLTVAPDEWKNAPPADRWEYPGDFEWIKGAVKDATYKGTKNAYSYGR